MVRPYCDFFLICFSMISAEDYFSLAINIFFLSTILLFYSLAAFFVVVIPVFYIFWKLSTWPTGYFQILIYRMSLCFDNSLFSYTEFAEFNSLFVFTSMPLHGFEIMKGAQKWTETLSTMLAVLVYKFYCLSYVKICNLI